MSTTADNHHDKITTTIVKNDLSHEGVMDQTHVSKTNKRVAIKVMSLALTIGFVWLLLLVPIIVFHLPDEVFLSQVS